jgi:hypothetical protein
MFGSIELMVEQTADWNRNIRDAWAPLGGSGLGRACISWCVHEWRLRPWQKTPGPTTPFSASNDAEDGSFGPNRKIHLV